MARLHGAIPRLMAWIAVVVGLCLCARSVTAATRDTYTLPYGYDPEFGLSMFIETIEVDATGVISDVDVFLSFFHDYEGTLLRVWGGLGRCCVVVATPSAVLVAVVVARFRFSVFVFVFYGDPSIAPPPKWSARRH